LVIRRSALKFAFALLALLFIAMQFSPQPAQAQVLGQDWTGTFYNNTSFSGSPVATAYFPEGLSCNWTNGVTNCLRSSQPQPISGVDTENYSVTLTSTQEFTQPGNYMFTLRYNDGLRLTLNDVVVHDDLNQLNTPDSSGTCQGVCKQVQITREVNDGPVKMRVDYVQYTGTAIVQVQWGFIGGIAPDLVNGNFEQALNGWTVKNSSGDRVKCDSSTKTYAYKGQCAFRFKGVSGENAKLQQVSKTKFYALGPLYLDGYVNAEGDVASQVKVIISYPDSDVLPSKFVYDITTGTDGEYVPLSTFTDTPILSYARSPFRIKVIIFNSGESGSVLFDALNLTDGSSNNLTPTPPALQLQVQPLPRP
jgi:hypothetical protein